ncbi:MAG: OB-fold domain-containing protein [Gammaproteobacteria bacterium]|nr:OB-fold domain-containing protein [Gammaproteobacteria bacterium]
MSEWRFERPPELPLPQPTEEAQPFFEALKERRLVVQCCTDCGALQHPPRAMCGSCQSMTFHWEEMSGKGCVYSYVVTHQAVHPALVGYTPLATVEVALAEGPHVTSNLVDVPPEAVTIGTPVEVVFDVVAAGVVLPLFRRISN